MENKKEKLSIHIQSDNEKITLSNLIAVLKKTQEAINDVYTEQGKNYIEKNKPSPTVIDVQNGSIWLTLLLTAAGNLLSGIGYTFKKIFKKSKKYKCEINENIINITIVNNYNKDDDVK